MWKIRIIYVIVGNTIYDLTNLCNCGKHERVSTRAQNTQVMEKLLLLVLVQKSSATIGRANTLNQSQVMISNSKLYILLISRNWKKKKNNLWVLNDAVCPKLILRNWFMNRSLIIYELRSVVRHDHNRYEGGPSSTDPVIGGARTVPRIAYFSHRFLTPMPDCE
jgi:hypothetical protein